MREEPDGDGTLLATRWGCTARTWATESAQALDVCTCLSAAANGSSKAPSQAYERKTVPTGNRALCFELYGITRTSRATDTGGLEKFL